MIFFHLLTAAFSLFYFVATTFSRNVNLFKVAGPSISSGSSAWGKLQVLIKSAYLLEESYP